MGRTIKISELKKFDVFLFGWNEYLWLGNGHFCASSKTDPYIDNVKDLNLMKFNDEVELIGRMEYKEEQEENSILRFDGDKTYQSNEFGP